MSATSLPPFSSTAPEDCDVTKYFSLTNTYTTSSLHSGQLSKPKVSSEAVVTSTVGDFAREEYNRTHTTRQPIDPSGQLARQINYVASSSSKKRRQPQNTVKLFNPQNYTPVDNVVTTIESWNTEYFSKYTHSDLPVCVEQARGQHDLASSTKCQPFSRQTNVNNECEYRLGELSKNDFQKKCDKQLDSSKLRRNVEDDNAINRTAAYPQIHSCIVKGSADTDSNPSLSKLHVTVQIRKDADNRDGGYLDRVESALPSSFQERSKDVIRSVGTANNTVAACNVNVQHRRPASRVSPVAARNKINRKKKSSVHVKTRCSQTSTVDDKPNSHLFTKPVSKPNNDAVLLGTQPISLLSDDIYQSHCLGADTDNLRKSPTSLLEKQEAKCTSHVNIWLRQPRSPESSNDVLAKQPDSLSSSEYPSSCFSECKSQHASETFSVLLTSSSSGPSSFSPVSFIPSSSSTISQNDSQSASLSSEVSTGRSESATCLQQSQTVIHPLNKSSSDDLTFSNSSTGLPLTDTQPTVKTENHNTLTTSKSYNDVNSNVQATENNEVSCSSKSSALVVNYFLDKNHSNIAHSTASDETLTELTYNNAPFSENAMDYNRTSQISHASFDKRRKEGSSERKSITSLHVAGFENFAKSGKEKGNNITTALKDDINEVTILGKESFHSGLAKGASIASTPTKKNGKMKNFSRFDVSGEFGRTLHPNALPTSDISLLSDFSASPASSRSPIDDLSPAHHRSVPRFPLFSPPAFLNSASHIDEEDDISDNNDINFSGSSDTHTDTFLSRLSSLLNLVCIRSKEEALFNNSLITDSRNRKLSNATSKKIPSGRLCFSCYKRQDSSESTVQENAVNVNGVRSGSSPINWSLNVAVNDSSEILNTSQSEIYNNDDINIYSITNSQIKKRSRLAANDVENTIGHISVRSDSPTIMQGKDRNNSYSVLRSKSDRLVTDQPLFTGRNSSSHKAGLNQKHLSTTEKLKERFGYRTQFSDNVSSDNDHQYENIPLIHASTTNISRVATNIHLPLKRRVSGFLETHYESPLEKIESLELGSDEENNNKKFLDNNYTEKVKEEKSLEGDVENQSTSTWKSTTTDSESNSDDSNDVTDTSSTKSDGGSNISSGSDVVDDTALSESVVSKSDIKVFSESTREPVTARMNSNIQPVIIKKDVPLPNVTNISFPERCRSLGNLQVAKASSTAHSNSLTVTSTGRANSLISTTRANSLIPTSNTATRAGSLLSTSSTSRANSLVSASRRLAVEHVPLRLTKSADTSKPLSQQMKEQMLAMRNMDRRPRQQQQG